MAQDREMHALARDGVRPIRDWRQWKELWEGTTVAEVRHSLLHFGFKIPYYSREDAHERVLFYLDIAADLGFSFDWYTAPGESSEPYQSSFGRESIGDIRKKISRKAFEVLCQEFFKDRDFEADRKYIPVWGEYAHHDDILDKLIWFARGRDEGRARGVFQNFGREGHHEGTARAFYGALACQILGIRKVPEEFGRGWRDRSGNFNDLLYEKREKYEAEFVEILFRLGYLFLLRSENAPRLTESGLKRLGEIAHSVERYAPNNPSGNSFVKVETLEESLVAGSGAAEALILLRIKYAEEDRLEGIRKLEAEERDVRRRREALSKVRTS